MFSRVSMKNAQIPHFVRDDNELCNPQKVTLSECVTGLWPTKVYEKPKSGHPKNLSWVILSEAKDLLFSCALNKHLGTGTGALSRNRSEEPFGKLRAGPAPACASVSNGSNTTLGDFPHLLTRSASWSPEATRSPESLNPAARTHAECRSR